MTIKSDLHPGARCALHPNIECGFDGRYHYRSERDLAAAEERAKARSAKLRRSLEQVQDLLVTGLNALTKAQEELREIRGEVDATRPQEHRKAMP